MAAGWEIREALSDALLQFLSCAAEERAEASIESELFAVVAYEVEDGAGCLSLGAAQASAQLLEEEGWAVGGAEEEEGVHHRDVDALVEEVDGEEELEDGPKCPAVKLSMIGYDRLSEWLGSAHDHVAALLAAKRESEFLQGADKLRARDLRQFAHTARRSASKCSAGTGSPSSLSART